MAIATYTDLRTYIASYVGKDSDTTITTATPDFITLAESRIAYGAQGYFPSEPLRIRAMETTIPLVVMVSRTMTTIAGTANAITATNTTPITTLVYGLHISVIIATTNTAATTLQVDSTSNLNVRTGSSRAALAGGELIAGATYEFYYDGTYWVLLPNSADVPLPSGYLAMRSFYLDTSPRVTLRYLPPAQLDLQYQSGSGDIAQPNAYTIEADAIRFGPPPDTTYYAWANYYKQFPALASATGGTNWLMTNAPGVYLFAALIEADLFLQDMGGTVPLLQTHYQQFNALCNGLQFNDERDRHPGPLTMQSSGTVR